MTWQKSQLMNWIIEVRTQVLNPSLKLFPQLIWLCFMTKAHFLFLEFFKVLKIVSCYLYYCDFTEN